MESCSADDEVVVLDFETTGLSTDYERIIEVGAAIVKDGEIKSTFDSLCDPGTSIPSFITSLTGITTAMVEGQPSPEEVMQEFNHYIGDRPLVAHNASFDMRFLKAEMERIDKEVHNPAICTMLLSRRLIHDVDNHKLGTLKRYIDYQETGDHKDHRALDDVKVTVSLWVHLTELVGQAAGATTVDFKTLQSLSRLSRHKVPARLAELAS